MSKPCVAPLILVGVLSLVASNACSRLSGMLPEGVASRETTAAPQAQPSFLPPIFSTDRQIVSVAMVSADGPGQYIGLGEVHGDWVRVDYPEELLDHTLVLDQLEQQGKVMVEPGRAYPYPNLFSADELTPFQELGARRMEQQQLTREKEQEGKIIVEQWLHVPSGRVWRALPLGYRIVNSEDWEPRSGSIPGLTLEEIDIDKR